MTLTIDGGGRKEAVKQPPEARKREAPLDLFAAETFMHSHIRV
jgi:hypothetical protein